MSGSTAAVSFATDNDDARRLLEQAVYRYKIALENARQRSGGTVRYIAQHSVLWGAMNGTEFSTAYWVGVCAGLSIEWLKAEAAGQDFVGQLIATRNEVFTKKEGARPGVATFTRGVGASHVAQRRFAAELGGVLREDGSAVAVAFPYTDLPRALRRGAYVYLSSGTHAMAAKVGDAFFGNTVAFYDPNVGELRGAKVEAVGTYLRDAVLATLEATGRPAADAAAKSMSVACFRRR